MELFEHIDRLRGDRGKLAVATLVSTRGTTPRKEGARMVVDERGAILGSVTIGGCVDAQVIEESGDVLRTMRPRLLELALGDEEAWEIGLTCGGTIEVLLEPLAFDQSADRSSALYVRARAHADSGHRAALVTRLDGGHGVDGAGAPPDGGAAGKLLVLEDGTTEGTLGSAALDGDAVGAALAVVREGASRVVNLPDARLFVEVVAPPALLLVVGASHVAMPLTTMAKVLGYRTVVIDGRPRFATRERFPDVDELRIGMPSELVTGYPLTPSTALVLVAHDYKYDLPVLQHALGTEVGYIGMLGSSRRGAAILQLLADDGVEARALARIRVPIGLDLGARTAPEIALAILAEIQAVRGGGTGQPMSVRRRAGDTA